MRELTETPPPPPPPPALHHRARLQYSLLLKRNSFLLHSKMDSITHVTNKMLAELARQQQQQTPPESAPPPYTATDEDSESDDDLDDMDDEEDDSSIPMKLTVNAAHNIQGCNNLVPTSPHPLADATKFSTLLLHAVNQINAANAAANSDVECSSKRRRPLKIELTVNCGITVVGDRNVIGPVAMKPRDTLASTSSSSAVAGAKRKADEPPVGEDEPATKKVAVDKE